MQNKILSAIVGILFSWHYAAANENNNFADGNPPLLDLLLPVISYFGVQGVVFPANYGQWFLLPCSREAPDGVTGFWEITNQTEIYNLEKTLEMHLKNVVEKKYRLESKLAINLKRQYVGLLKGKNKYIYANVFYGGALKNAWRKRPINVCDGGIYNFGVEYNIHERSISKIAFNGPEDLRSDTPGHL